MLRILDAKMGSYFRMLGALFIHVLVINVVESRNNQRSHFNADVLILGAGATGIAAAKVLNSHGIDNFVILEGSHRVGGRMMEVPFGGKVVEVGANWIQPNNENLNPVVGLAKKYKLKGKPSNWDSIIFRNAEGKNVTREALVVRHQLDKSLDYTHDLALELLENNKSDMSIRAALRLAKWNPRTPIDEVLEYLRVDFEYGGIAYVTSLKSTAVVVNDKDLFVTDQRGYSVLIKKMSNEFMKQGDLRLRYGKVVTAITWTNNSVTVRCQDDTVYTAPFALITFSIGVLQNDVIMFDPPLPTWKMLEIKQFEMALYTKIFLKFPKNATRFWDEQEFILHAHPRRGFYPVWQNLEAPGLFDVGTNILMVTVTGEESKRLEGQNDNVIRSEVMNVLRHMYGDNIPDVEEIMLHRWSRDPLYFGAYSNWPVEVSIGAQKRLQANLGRLFFGGEATDPKWNGYVEAALFSGQREAMKILRCMSGNCPQYTP